MKYKTIAHFLLVLCCAASAAFAQDIDALLSKMPADNAAAFNTACADMLAAGPAAIQQIAGRLVPMGQGDDNAARYAISGLAKYVTRPGAGNERETLSSALGEALKSDQPAEVKQFLMEQLQIAGGPEVVPVLQGFLNDPELGGPASRALESIGVVAAPGVAQAAPAALPADPALQEAQDLLAAGKSREAGKALEAVINDKNIASATRVNALKLLVRARERGALFGLIDAGTSDDAGLRAAALGLASTIDGSVATRKWGRALEGASPAVQVDLLQMLAKRNDSTAIDSAAKMLHSDDHGVRMAAVETLAAIGTEDAVKQLQKFRGEAKDSDELAATKNALRKLAPESVWTPTADAEGFIPLSNGHDMEGWTGHTAGYDVQDGVMTSRKNALNVYTEDQFGNFILRFEFQLTENANNGIGIRVPLYGHAAYDGMEIQVLDDAGPEYKNIEPYQHHGSVYGIVPAEPGPLKTLGEWNEEEITVNGSHVTVVLNGATIVDADVVEAAKPEPMDGKDHPGLTRDKGHISLAGHNRVVSFRNMRIKPLD